MISTVEIMEVKERGNGWDVAVSVRDVDAIMYSVRVERAYWQQLTDEKEDVSSLVKRSFQFLLEHEPKESILRTFDLPKIQHYFSSFEATISLV